MTRPALPRSGLSRIMKMSTFLSAFTGVVLLSFCVRANAGEARATYIDIEGAMRVWQERYLLSTGASEPIKWPARKDGTVPEKYPAPCFYQKDLMQKNGDQVTIDQARLAELVRAIAEAMTIKTEVPLYEESYLLPVLGRFIVPTIGGGRPAQDIAGSEGDVTFAGIAFVQATDPITSEEGRLDPFPRLRDNTPFTNITAQNCEEKFIDIVDLYLRQLEFMSLRSTFTDIEEHAEKTAIGVRQDDVRQVLDSSVGFTLRDGGDDFNIPIGFQCYIEGEGELPGELNYTVQSWWASGRFKFDVKRFNGPMKFYTRRWNLGAPITQGFFGGTSGAIYNAANYQEEIPTGWTEDSGEIRNGVWRSSLYTPRPVSSLSVTAVPVPEVPDQVLGDAWQMDARIVIAQQWEQVIDDYMGPEECCETCPTCEPGSGQAEVGSVDFTINLGRDLTGKGNGELRIEAETPSAKLAKPAGLRRRSTGHRARGAIDPADPERALRQVVTDTVVADVVTLTPFKYQIRFYHTADRGVLDPVTALYAPDAARAFKIYTIENPDASTVRHHRLQITEQARDEAEKRYLYTFTAARNEWALETTAEGVQSTETRQVSIVGNRRVVTHRVREGDGAEIQTERRTYETFPWNDSQSRIPARRDELVEVAIDPDGANRVTQYSYYASQSLDGAANYRRLKQVIHHDGRWERYRYRGHGELAATITPWLNAAPGAADGEARVLTEEQIVLPDADADGLPEQGTLSVESIRSMEVRRSYTVAWSKPVAEGGLLLAKTADIVCLTPGAAWNAAENLVTTRWQHRSGPFSGHTRRVREPDGTLTVSSYAEEGGSRTEVTEMGAPDDAGLAVIDGTRRVMATNASGTVISSEAIDIASGITVESEEALETDAFGRVVRMAYLDGTTASWTYGCCRLESMVDRTGSVTFYEYDGLGRETERMVAGITNRQVYDSLGRVTKQTRVGRDGVEHLVAETEYDRSGDIAVMRDALGFQTTQKIEHLGTGETLRTTER